MNTDKASNSNGEDNASDELGVKDEGLKKQNSYTYWTRDIKSDNLESSKIKPTQIEDNNKLDTLPLTNKSGASAWNTGGTWEEKHFKSQQVKDFFEKHLPIAFRTFTFKKLTSISGDVRIVII